MLTSMETPSLVRASAVHQRWNMEHRTWNIDVFTTESRWQEQVAFEALNICNTLGKHMLTMLPKY
jgi:hypothetical protein